jgi:hypothetical protein
MTTVNAIIDGIHYNGVAYHPRSLYKTNPEFVKAEKEFLAGKRWQFIKVTFKLADGTTSTGPRKPKPCKTL